MSDLEQTPLRRSRAWLIALLAVGAVLVVSPAIVLFVFVRPWDDAQITSADSSGPALPEPQAEGDFSSSNSVTILLGENESSQGLRHIDDQTDGLTAVETVDGTSARVLRLTENRNTGYFYFEIHPTFKGADLRSVRIDVEYLDPQPGSLGIHYDAEDSEEVSNPRYRQATPSVRLEGSNTWKSATFRTKNDANFGNRQNGGADFRLSARTPALFVRRVTVTREAGRNEEWAMDHSASNSVSIELGRENPQDGLRHRADESDGRTRIANLDGVPCRHLNRVPDRKTFGYLYFAIEPAFKRERLTNARVDIEYFSPRGGSFRLQFDGLEDGTRRRYAPVLPVDSRIVKFGPRIDYARIPTVNAWATATFHITNAVFKNTQNGDSDFRLEVVPPEIYVRRVTVSPEEAPDSK